MKTESTAGINKINNVKSNAVIRPKSCSVDKYTELGVLKFIGN